MEENICHFVPFHKDMHSIHTINFVLETESRPYDQLKIESVYKMHYVCSGRGFLHTTGQITPLKKGDIFFTFPASPFAIETVEDFTYMYITFIGLRGNMILDSLNISNTNFIFRDADELYEFWRKGLLVNPTVMDLMSESVLLYTFSFLGDRLSLAQDRAIQNHTVALIKKYIDEHFSEQEFSLESISEDLSYNKKYISSIFKKHMGMGIIDYLNTIRLQNACTMMKQGFTSVNDIAHRCGYASSQYFSKNFKLKVGITPTQYMTNLQNEGE